MIVERRADHAVSESSCRQATGRTLADWFKALDRRGGIAPGRRALTRWLTKENEVDPWWATTVINEYEIARGNLARDGKPRGYRICPTRTMSASAADCYAAFTTATALDQWFGPAHDVDVRDGGHWRNGDGNQAVIRKVTPGKVIRLLAEDGGLTLPAPVDIRFATRGAKCTIRVSIDRLQTRAEADGYRRAWAEALDRLAAHLEKPPVISARRATRD